MRRSWLLGFGLILLIQAFGIGMLRTHIPFQTEGEHNDAVVMVQRIREANNPWQWFVSDWPLYNGFYRPLPSLAYEMDHRLYGFELRLFGITNWIIALACSFLIVWFVWELFRRKWPAISCGAVFSFWQAGWYLAIPVVNIGAAVAIGCLLAGIYYWTKSGPGSLGRWAAAGALCYVLARELAIVFASADITNQNFAFRTIGWSPGRTATIMTVFALISLAAYCRFERARRFSWAIVSVAGLLLAFGSYEQSVVVAPSLLACAIALRFQGIRVRWLYHAVPWGLTLTYVALHRALLEQGTRYRLQVYRGYGGLRDIIRWLFPAAFEVRLLWIILPIGPLVFILGQPYALILTVSAQVVAYVEARKEWLPLAFGLFVSAGTYGPLAMQHPLSHYYHFPLAMRTIFVVWLAMLTWKTISNAASHPAPEVRQEPARAPG